MSADAFHMTAWPPKAKAASAPCATPCATQISRRAKIDYVNAHATSTPLGDALESNAIRNFFGKKVPVSSTKSMTGHLLGGAGGLEAGVTVLALRDQILPPTINLENQDPETEGHGLRPQPSPQSPIRLRHVQLLRLRRHQRRAVIPSLDGIISIPCHSERSRRPPCTPIPPGAQQGIPATKLDAVKMFTSKVFDSNLCNLPSTL